MTEPVIKICGLKTPAVALAASAAGASAIGLMLAPSKRQVGVADIQVILDALPGDRPRSVGVFANPSVTDVMNVVEATGIDVVQLSGDEEPAILDDLDTVVWKGVRFAPGTKVDEARELIEPWLSHRRPVTHLLFDAAVPGQYGGTGHRADWDLAAALAEHYPLILAGGLNPGNVGEAIATVRPAGVDVSSGVETCGAKDQALISRFVEESRLAFARLDAHNDVVRRQG